MRTTINIEDRLLRQLKVTAADSGQTISQIAEEAIRAFLVPRKGDSSKRIMVPVSRHDMGKRRGVDLDSNASIMEILDEEQMEKIHATARR